MTFAVTFPSVRLCCVCKTNCIKFALEDNNSLLIHTKIQISVSKIVIILNAEIYFLLFAMTYQKCLIFTLLFLLQNRWECIWYLLWSATNFVFYCLIMKCISHTDLFSLKLILCWPFLHSLFSAIVLNLVS